MRRHLSFGILILIILIAGCNNVDLSKLSDEDLERISDKAIVCEGYYIRVGAECCLDKNNNSVCDKDEVTVEQKPKNQNYLYFNSTNEFREWFAYNFSEDWLPLIDDLIKLNTQVQFSTISRQDASTYAHDYLIRWKSLKELLERVYVADNKEIEKMVDYLKNSVEYSILATELLKEGLENYDSNKIKLAESYVRRATEEITKFTEYVQTIDSNG